MNYKKNNTIFPGIIVHQEINKTITNIIYISYCFITISTLKILFYVKN